MARPRHLILDLLLLPILIPLHPPIVLARALATNAKMTVIVVVTVMIVMIVAVTVITMVAVVTLITMVVTVVATVIATVTMTTTETILWLFPTWVIHSPWPPSCSPTFQPPWITPAGIVKSVGTDAVRHYDPDPKIL